MIKFEAMVIYIRSIESSNTAILQTLTISDIQGTVNQRVTMNVGDMQTPSDANILGLWHGHRDLAWGLERAKSWPQNIV